MKWIMAYLLYFYIFVFIQEYSQAHNLYAVPFMAGKEKDTKHIKRTIITTTEEQIKKNCMCSKIYDPVCGSNNKSYYNPCQLECENQNGTVFIQHQGNCIPF